MDDDGIVKVRVNLYCNFCKSHNAYIMESQKRFSPVCDICKRTLPSQGTEEEARYDWENANDPDELIEEYGIPQIGRNKKRWREHS